MLLPPDDAMPDYLAGMLAYYSGFKWWQMGHIERLCGWQHARYYEEHK
mgnify:CR=1 FL=1|tara:strand:+ start:2867 stop:3010 length:144 start_codon:yes stop_codon:yes gene_type:complete